MSTTEHALRTLERELTQILAEGVRFARARGIPLAGWYKGEALQRLSERVLRAPPPNETASAIPRRIEPGAAARVRSVGERSATVTITYDRAGELVHAKAGQRSLTIDPTEMTGVYHSELDHNWWSKGFESATSNFGPYAQDDRQEISLDAWVERNLGNLVYGALEQVFTDVAELLCQFSGAVVEHGMPPDAQLPTVRVQEVLLARVELLLGDAKGIAEMRALASLEMDDGAAFLDGLRKRLRQLDTPKAKALRKSLDG